MDVEYLQALFNRPFDFVINLRMRTDLDHIKK
jgi:hypothetical protein